MQINHVNARSNIFYYSVVNVTQSQKLVNAAQKKFLLLSNTIDNGKQGKHFYKLNWVLCLTSHYSWGRCNIVTFKKWCVLFSHLNFESSVHYLAYKCPQCVPSTKLLHIPKYPPHTSSRGSTQKCTPHFQEWTSSCFKQSKVQNRWNNTPERTKVLESGEKSWSWNQNKNFELALLISAS